MAVAGQRSTSSYSTSFGVNLDTFLSSLDSTPKTSGPGWISLEDTSYDSVFGQVDGRTTLTGYEFTCTIVFDPGSGVSAGDYSYSFDIILSKALGGTVTVGTVSGTETVTVPEEPEEPDEPSYSISVSGPSAQTQLRGDSFDISFTITVTPSNLFIGTSSSSPSWASPGSLTLERSVVEESSYGLDFSGTIPGDASGDYTFSVTAWPTSNPSDTYTAEAILSVVTFDRPEVPSFNIEGRAGSSFNESQDVILNGWTITNFDSGGGHDFIDLSSSGFPNITVSGIIPSDGQPGDSWTHSYGLAFLRSEVTSHITVSATITVSIAAVTIPSWSNPPSGSAISDQSFSIDLTPTTGNTDDISYSVTGHSSGSLSGSSIVGTAPLVSSEQSYTWGVSATNSAGTGNTTATLTVSPAPSPGDEPSIGNIPSPLFSVAAGSSNSGSISSYISGGGTVVILQGSGSSWITISSDGSVSASPSSSVSAGNYSRSFSATSIFGSASGSVTIEVTAGPTVTAPSYTTPPSSTVNVDQPFNISLVPQTGTAPFTYSISGHSSGSLSGSNISGTAPSSTGDYTWSVSTSNSAGSTTTTATLTVVGEDEEIPEEPEPTTPTPPPTTPDEPDEPGEPTTPTPAPGNTAPSFGNIPSPFITVRAGESQSRFLRNFVTGSGVIVLSKTSGAAWVTVFGNGNVVAAPPSSVSAGNYTVAVDALSIFGADSDTITIQVNPAVVTPTPTTAPVVGTISNITIAEGSSIRIDISGSVTGTVTSYSVSSSPSLSGLQISSVGIITANNAPQVTANTNYTITVTATNSAGSNSGSFTLTVRNANLPRFLDVPDSALRASSRGTYSIDMSTYAENYTTLNFLESIPWASVSGTTLSGTLPYIAGTSTYTFGVVLINEDGTVSNTYTITATTTDAPTFLVNAALDEDVVEGESFTRDFSRMIARGASPYSFSLVTPLTGTFLNWLSFSGGILSGSAAPFVSADTQTPTITVRATDSNGRSSTASFRITILDSEGRERPKFTAIPDQIAIPGRSFLLPISDYLTGDRPISVDQDEDQRQHAWLRVQPDGEGGSELIGNTPFDRNQRSDRTIVVSLIAENTIGEDRTSFNLTIQAPTVGAPTWNRIGSLRRRTGTTVRINPQIFLSGNRPINVTLKAGSESTWLTERNGIFQGTAPGTGGADSIFQNNTFIAQNAQGTTEESFVIEIYQQTNVFEWSSNISNISEFEGDPVNYDISRFAVSNPNNEFRFSANQPTNPIEWANLELSTDGTLTSTAAPQVSKNETFRVRVEGRINTTQVWVEKEFIITIFNKLTGTATWSAIPHQRVDENTVWSFPTIGYVSGQTPISIVLTSGRNNPDWIRIDTRGNITGRGGRTPSVNRDTQFTIYLTAYNYTGVSAQTSFEMTVRNVGPTVTGPSVNSLVTIERNSNVPLNESIVNLMVNTFTGTLRFTKTSGNNLILISRNGFLIGRTPTTRVTTDYDIGINITDDTGTTAAVLRVRVIGLAGQRQPSFVTFDIPDINEATSMSFDVNQYVRGATPIVLSLTANNPSWLSMTSGVLQGVSPNIFNDTPVRVEIQASNRFGRVTTIKNFTVFDTGSLTWDEGIGQSREVFEGDRFRLDCNQYISGEKPIIIGFTTNRFTPTWLNISNGIISGIAPQVTRTRDHRIFINAVNSHGSLETSFILKVKNRGVAPTISGIPDLTKNEGSEIALFTHAYATGENLEFLMSGHPSTLEIDENTGLIRGTAPIVPEDKQYDIEVTVVNDDGEDSDTFRLIVNDITEGAPVWKQIEPIIIDEGREISRQLKNYLEDSTEFPVEFFKTPNNISSSWVTINRNSGLMSGRARTVAEETQEQVYVTARNSKGQDSTSIMITIRDIILSGDPPQWNQIQDLEIDEGEMIRLPTNPKLVGQAAIGFNNNPVDEEGNIIEWQSPEWLEISTDGTGLITGTAPFISVPREVHTIYLIAINQSPQGRLQSASISFNIIVNDVTGLRPEIEKITVPEGFVNGPFSVDLDFNVDVTNVSLDSFDFSGVSILPHTLYHGLTPNSRGSVTNNSTVARYFSLRFPSPPDGALGNLNVYLKRHSVRIAVTEEEGRETPAARPVFGPFTQTTLFEDTPYDQTITASNSNSITSQVTSGSLPLNVMLEGDRLYSDGNPEAVDASGTEFTIEFLARGEGGTTTKSIDFRTVSNRLPVFDGFAISNRYLTEGIAYNQSVTATGYPTPVITSSYVSGPTGGLSAHGLTLSGATISGTPRNVPDSGFFFNIDFTATNTYGTDTMRIAFYVNNAAPMQPTSRYSAPSFNSFTPAALTIGTPTNQTITATGNPAPTITSARSQVLEAKAYYVVSSGSPLTSNRGIGIGPISAAETNRIISDKVKSTQTFYADQMAARGYGRQTFQLSLDGSGNVPVERIVLPQTEAQMEARYETARASGNPIDFYYWITTLIGTNPTKYRGFLNLFFLEYIPGDTAAAGYGLYPPTRGAIMNNWGESADRSAGHLTLHETGHALGLRHEDGAGLYLMSTSSIRDVLSPRSAAKLNRTNAFQIASTSSVPNGLTLNGATLSGTPAAGTAGSFTVVFTATSSAGTVKRIVTFTIGT